MSKADTTCTIMVVDDDLVSRVTMEHMLRKAGYTVALAENGHAALERLRAGLFPDLVLMDVEMPVLSGPDALSQIRQDPGLAFMYKIPVLALTAHGMAEDVRALIRIGFSAVVCKPVNNADLLTTIRTVLAPKP